MNQLVSQLILGNALDGSSVHPTYIPVWGCYPTWAFSSDNFFEVFNPQTETFEAHAAYVRVVFLHTNFSTL